MDPGGAEVSQRSGGSQEFSVVRGAESQRPDNTELDLARSEPKAMDWYRFLGKLLPKDVSMGLWLRRRLRQGLGHEPSLPFLETVVGQDRVHLLHILACRQCRRQAKKVLIKGRLEDLPPWMAQCVTNSPPLAIPTAADSAPWPSKESRLVTGSELADQLAGLSSRQQDELLSEKDLSGARASEALAAAAAAALEDPSRGERILDLAGDVLAFDRTAPPEVLARRRLAICALRMVFRRRSGRIREAEAAYSDAVPLLAQVEAGAAERGWLLATLGQLRWAQRRNDEARALLGAAAWILRRAEAEAAEGASRLLAGLLDYDAFPARAREELERGLAAVDDDLAPVLVEVARCAEMCCNVLEGRWGEVKRLVDEYGRAGQAGSFSAQGLDRSAAAYVGLWQARLLACAGSKERAVQRWEEMRRLLLSEGSLREAATFTIGLLLWASEEEINPQGLSSLASDLRAAFGSGIAEVERCAREIETLIDLGLKGSPVYADRAEAALREWEAYDGPDRPDLLAAPPDLADAALVSEMLGKVGAVGGVGEVDEADEVEA